ncbi:nitroreductase [Paraburkholderia sp. J41]|uniref:nitroreductase family protein n=1 Tax=Paraburkholderia sp. J41 TaxID=2805433 RepID=UPI002AC34416|nr:nitroreductase [Paraburkholderia sp. J41]
MQIEYFRGTESVALNGGGMQSSHPVSLHEAIQRRRSVYAFLNAPVPRGVVERALDLAVLAPCHHQTHPWRFFVFEGAGRERLATAYKAAAERLGMLPEKAIQRAYDAPVMIAIVCQPMLKHPRVKQWEEEFATTAATQTLMLALSAAGVGTLLTTGSLPESVEVRRLLGLDQPEAKMMGVLNVGYRNPERPLMARPAASASAATHWISAS